MFDSAPEQRVDAGGGDCGEAIVTWQDHRQQIAVEVEQTAASHRVHERQAREQLLDRIVETLDR